MPEYRQSNLDRDRIRRRFRQEVAQSAPVCRSGWNVTGVFRHGDGDRHRFPRRPSAGAAVHRARLVSTECRHVCGAVAADHRASGALFAALFRRPDRSSARPGLTYAIFAAFTIKEHKPTLDEGISGCRLLAVVATQSIAVLGALLAPHIAQPYRLEMNFLALSMWLWGGMLYIWMMSLIFYRYTFFRLASGDLSPPYWINIRAMAISTLAGSLLIINVPDAPFLLSLLPFLKGFTVFYWATGTWWIPMLLVLGLWRHVYKRFPFKYDPLYWGAVFPLGMYATSTREMMLAMGFGFLDFLPRIFLYAAFLAWSAHRAASRNCRTG